MNVLLWIMEHGPTCEALLLTGLIAFVAGAAFQYCDDDKKGQQRGNAESPK